MSESKPEEIKATEPVKEEKEASTGKKGQFSARGGRGGGGRNQAVKYVKKGEAAEPEEEKGENHEVKEPKEHKERKEYKDKENKDYNRYKKEKRDYVEKEREREKVTLETVIPEKPKKHEVLKEPSEEEFHKKTAEIDDKIDAIHEKLHKYSKEMRETQYKNKSNKDTLPMKDLFMFKISESKKLNDELKTLRVQMEDKKAVIEDLFNKATKYRQKLKTFFKRDEIEAELKNLIETQKKGNITLTEEKKIIKEIAELERALPFATPLEAVQKEMEELKVEKKKLGELMGGLINQREKISAEIDELKNDMENRKKEKEDVQKNLDPIIQSKKEEYYKEIDTLKEERHKLKEKYQKDCDDFYKQQRLIQRIDWLTKIKNRLKREEEYKKQEEEQKKLEEEEKKETEKFNPHQEDINLCDLLINYVQNLLPKTASLSNPTEKKPEVVAQNVQDEWKKEKVTVIQSKKENDNDFFSAKNKKKKEVKKKEEAVNPNLQHQFEVLAYFERLKVAPPLFVAKLEETIKLLKEKKDYYSGLPLTDSGAEKKPEGEENEKKPAEHKPKKTEGGNKHGIEMNESDFPTI